MRKLLSTLEPEKTKHAAFNITADKKHGTFYIGLMIWECFGNLLFFLKLEDKVLYIDCIPGLHAAFVLSWAKMLSHIFRCFSSAPLMKSLFNANFLSTHSGPIYHQSGYSPDFFCFYLKLKPMIAYDMRVIIGGVQRDTDFRTLLSENQAISAW